MHTKSIDAGNSQKPCGNRAGPQTRAISSAPLSCASAPPVPTVHCLVPLLQSMLNILIQNLLAIACETFMKNIQNELELYWEFDPHREH